MNDLLNEMIENNISIINGFSNPEVAKLYKLVNDYMNNNGLCQDNEYGTYLIKENGNCFEIGFSYGPDLFYYVKRIDETNINQCIDMNYIRVNIVPVKEAIIRNEIKEINDRINHLEERGVSKRLIKKYMNM